MSAYKLFLFFPSRTPGKSLFGALDYGCAGATQVAAVCPGSRLRSRSICRWNFFGVSLVLTCVGISDRSWNRALGLNFTAPEARPPRKIAPDSRNPVQPGGMWSGSVLFG